MVKVELNFYQRINLWLRVGGVQAPNMQVAAALFRVIEKLRPTDREREEAHLVTQENGSVTWTLDNANYGIRFVELEEDESKHLAETLENPQQVMPWRVDDMRWVLPLMDQLKGRSVPAMEQELVAAV